MGKRYVFTAAVSHTPRLQVTNEQLRNACTRTEYYTLRNDHPRVAPPIKIARARGRTWQW